MKRSVAQIGESSLEPPAKRTKWNTVFAHDVLVCIFNFLHVPESQMLKCLSLVCHQFYNALYASNLIAQVKFSWNEFLKFPKRHCVRRLYYEDEPLVDVNTLSLANIEYLHFYSYGGDRENVKLLVPYNVSNIKTLHLESFLDSACLDEIRDYTNLKELRVADFCGETECNTRPVLSLQILRQVNSDRYAPYGYSEDAPLNAPFFVQAFPNLQILEFEAPVYRFCIVDVMYLREQLPLNEIRVAIGITERDVRAVSKENLAIFSWQHCSFVCNNEVHAEVLSELFAGCKVTVEEEVGTDFDHVETKEELLKELLL